MVAAKVYDYVYANHKNCLATGQLARESIITNLFGYIFINDL